VAGHIKHYGDLHTFGERMFPLDVLVDEEAGRHHNASNGSWAVLCAAIIGISAELFAM
jgi:hypothetical protein